MSQKRSFNRPAWTGTPELIAELWTLHKGKRTAVCALWSHSDGAELRLDVEGRESTTLVSEEVAQLLDVAVAWNNELKAKSGWSERE